MYIDRAVVGTAAPAIMREFGLSMVAMGWSASAFNWSYALLQMPGGWMADTFGPRIVLAGAMAWWSIFTAATGLAGGAVSLAITRGLFGAGEAAAFPAASRSLGPWLPESRRAFGQATACGHRGQPSAARCHVHQCHRRLDLRQALRVLGRSASRQSARLGSGLHDCGHRARARRAGARCQHGAHLACDRARRFRADGGGLVGDLPRH